MRWFAATMGDGYPILVGNVRSAIGMNVMTLSSLTGLTGLTPYNPNNAHVAAAAIVGNVVIYKYTIWKAERGATVQALSSSTAHVCPLILSGGILPTAASRALAACRGEHDDAGDEDPIYTERKKRKNVSRLHLQDLVPLGNLALKALAFVSTCR
ncbi:hypothetical protein BC826DRAFT_967699 [Russula brevipes]|nr:hypothetical protein BC826DRAFT_967699 [Russula brevipes]